MNREMSRLQQHMMRDFRHMRNAMNRLTPTMTPSDHANDLVLREQLQLIRDPLVTESDGTRRMKVQEDRRRTAGGPQPAKHEEKSDTSHVYQEFSRCFVVPEGVNADTLTCSLSRDGVLTVTSSPLPMIEAPKEKKLAITQEK
ncbi:hypothetical protein CHS0354_042289 [Potamilus streckersoni]|uniref:SHSP domain-containing protein n=1 Tax=Potamilus streckersoni TaxID=2493646 RepID=A0AAE0W1R2_9BIVA|nr:hypothetical protein CHS0354_042289 [Potamilus streckersoni]